MNNCPICPDPSACRGYPALWERLARPDGHRWHAIHAQVNATAGPPPEHPPPGPLSGVPLGGCCG